MGKSRNTKYRSPRSNPLGSTSSNDISLEEGMTDNNKQVYEITGDGVHLSPSSIKSLLQQLQSPSAEDRDCACNALATLVRDCSDVKVALDEGVIKVIGPLLVDSSASVRHSASLALHRLLSVGGDQAVKLSLEDDILTSLITVLRRLPPDWKPHGQTSDKIDTKKAIFLEVVGSLWILSESSSLAVDRIHREGVPSILIKYLDINHFGTEVVTVTAQCLSTITEDQGNTDYKDDLKKQIISQLLQSECSTLLLKTLAIGILLNVNNGLMNDDLGITPGSIIQIFTSVLQMDHRKSASHIMDCLPVKKGKDEEDDEDVMESDENPTNKLKDEISAAEDLLNSQIGSLEILTNLCASSEESDYEDADEDDSSNCDSFEVDGMTLDNVQIELGPELKQSLLESGIFQLVLNKANLPAENVCQSLREHRAGRVFLEHMETLQSRAFLCLSNLATSLSVDEMGGSKQLFDIWCNLGRVAFQSPCRSQQILEAATTSMRSIIHKFVELDSDIVHLIKVDDVAVLCQQLQTCTESRSKVNMIQVLGTLGSMAAGTEPPLIEPRSSVVKVVGQLLLDIACLEEDLWIVSESMDALFDVFKEDHADFVAVDIQLVERLRNLVPAFKRRVQSQRRNLGENTPVVMTAKENLLRFIKYKTKQRSR